MTPKEHLIACLDALCKRTAGGVSTVAMELGASEENLKQILAGTKLPSGNPRGVGPLLQKKLDARYPGWSKLAPAMVATEWPLRRLTPSQWKEIDPLDWAVAEDAAIEKLAKLASERASRQNDVSSKQPGVKAA